jgi:hypothetical protein
LPFPRAVADFQAGGARQVPAWKTETTNQGQQVAEGKQPMADADRAVEVRGTVTVHPDGVSSDPAALVADIEQTRQDLARTIDLLADRVSPANAARRLRERALEQAARPEVRLGAVAVGLVIGGIVVLRIWGRRRK